MWKVAAASVPGTAHAEWGLPCQDAHEVRQLVVADGAGSARLAEVGAGLACSTLLTQAEAGVRRHGPGDVPEGAVRDWFTAARERLRDEARSRGIPPRELACTAMHAGVGQTGALYAQVGDGAIVTAQPGHYLPVVWPSTGEYANETDFLTDDRMPDHLVINAPGPGTDEVALLTDGLQRLALDYATLEGHPAFFGPLFRTLRTLVRGNPRTHDTSRPAVLGSRPAAGVRPTGIGGPFAAAQRRDAGRPGRVPRAAPTVVEQTNQAGLTRAATREQPARPGRTGPAASPPFPAKPALPPGDGRAPPPAAAPRPRAARPGSAR